MTARESEVAVPTSGSLIKVISRGRKTGLPHIVTVRFVFHDGAFYVMGGRSGADWVKNALEAGTVRLRLGEVMYEASVALADPQESSDTFLRFSRKYGTRMANGWYVDAETCMKLSPLGSPTRRGAATGEGGVRTTFSEWNRPGRGYYGEVAGAFDSASEEYDYTIKNNFINMWIRKRSIQELLQYARADDVLLELGCGTGAEAMEISNYVAGVVATDISPGMIALLRRKVDAKGAGDRIPVLRLGATEISQAAASLPGGNTRVAYSFNGALNCEPSIESVPTELTKVIEQDGYFVCSIRNTLCLSEALSPRAVPAVRPDGPEEETADNGLGGRAGHPLLLLPSLCVRAVLRPAVQGEEDDSPARLPPARLSQRRVLQGEGGPRVRGEGGARHCRYVPLQSVRRPDALRLPEEVILQVETGTIWDGT